MKPESRRPLIFDIHRYALDDGPGIRTTVFFKGCPLTCLWCHNPEGMLSDPELGHYHRRCIACGDCVAACPRQAIGLDAGVIEIHREQCDVCGLCADQCPAGALEVKGRFYTVAELTALLLKDRRFYANSNGGITLSGGEPTRHPDFLTRLVQNLKAHDLHIALQTCGLFGWETFEKQLLPWIDLIFFDLKAENDALHRQWTGRSNRLILDNFSKLAETAPDKLVCTIPLVLGMTAQKKNIRSLARRVGSIQGLRYRLHPYHPGALFKAGVLGRRADDRLPAHAMAADQYHGIAAEFETIVNSQRKRRSTMGFTIRGTIQREDTRQGMADLVVEALDADLFCDDLLGRAQTDARGAFAIECPDQGECNAPDLFLQIKTAQGDLLHTTRHQIMQDVAQDTEFDITLQRAALARAGLATPDTDAAGDASAGEDTDLHTLTLRDREGQAHPDLIQARKDLEKQASVLELFKTYKEALDKSADNDHPAYAKMAALFDAARIPDSVQGHYYGVTVGIRIGGMPESMAEYGNVLGLLWGTALSNECPWVGKSLTPVPPARYREITGASAPDDAQGPPVMLGINHFNRIHTRILNPIAFQVLNAWMDLYPAPEEEQRQYNWERNGAYFLGRHADSVCEDARRPVYQLNYRYKALGNRMPNCWLIDELVEIAPGLLLGQLCYATRKLLGDYDDQRPIAQYRYRNFGYFLLLDSRWHAEARRLFPYLEVPPDAPGMVSPHVSKTIRQARFTTFTVQSPAPTVCKESMWQEVQARAAQYPTILHYLKGCARSLQDNLSNQSPCFDQLAELFNRGIAPDTMDGFYYGALVSWHSAGIFELFGKNTINMIYTAVGAPFSTWTGKRFDPISRGRLMEVTDGHETGEVPTVWGANTQALRTLKERFVGRLMRIADVWTEEADDQEKQKLGYDVKNFFFIARPALSIAADSQGKTVYQFNYRWPRLKTIIPDCFCIDEVVQIARGLFLGRLMYATNITRPYDPDKDPSVYDYRMFGYFLLMDRQWQQVRLAIGYDLENV